MKTRWLLILVLGAVGCAKGPPTSPSEVVAVYRDALPGAPDDAVWREAPVHPAPLLRQDMVEPRLIESSTPEVRVQAVTDGSRVAMRLEWDDATEDTLPGMSRFVDACAVQLPMRPSPDVPAPQMGEEGRWVEITYWSSAWQAAVDGRPDTIQELYPGATVDHYPFEAQSLEKGTPKQEGLRDMYSPARTLGNIRSGARTSAVEDLVAEGPGTMEPAPKSVSQGRGKRTARGWSVVLSRPLPDGVRVGDRSQVALAIWDGSHKEVGAKKMRSVWIPLLIEGAP